MYYYVDDDPDDLLLFEEVLRELGYPSRTFGSADALFDSFPLPEMPDILFLDLNMPRISGLELLERLRSTPSFNDVPIVIYSVGSHWEIVDRCRKMGANLYVAKPRDFLESVRTLQQVLKIDWNRFVPGPNSFLLGQFRL